MGHLPPPGMGQEPSLEEKRGVLGLLPGKTLQNLAAHPPPRERHLQMEVFTFKANACRWEGISGRGDARSLGMVKN